MNCSECLDLYRAFERTRVGYVEALSAAFYKISAEVVARKGVVMERTKNDLQEHQLVCPWARGSEFLGRQQTAIP